MSISSTSKSVVYPHYNSNNTSQVDDGAGITRIRSAIDASHIVMAQSKQGAAIDPADFAGRVSSAFAHEEWQPCGSEFEGVI